LLLYVVQWPVVGGDFRRGAGRVALIGHGSVPAVLASGGGRGRAAARGVPLGPVTERLAPGRRRRAAARDAAVARGGVARRCGDPVCVADGGAGHGTGEA